MDRANLLITDTDGSLSKDTFKMDVDRPAISAWLSNTPGESRTLNVSLDNVRIDSVPNIANSTYKTFLAYNGTLGLSNKVFSTVVKELSGVFNLYQLPTIEYDPNTLTMPDADELEDVVIDIKMYNGSIDILQYSEGILNNGEKSYYVKSKRAYPTQVTGMPNVSSKRVFMDGWYSYTTIIFRNIAEGASVYKDTFYGIDGFIFKASHDGKIFKNSSKANTYVIMRTGDVVISDGVVQKSNENYQELLFSLNATDGISSQANHVFIHSQLLVTDQLRDAITAEAVEAAFACESDYIDFQKWQQLTLKREAAGVMFLNGLFENAQIIMESARSVCAVPKYNSKC